MKPLHICLPKELYEELRKRSYEEHKSIAQLIREALLSIDTYTEALEPEDKPKEPEKKTIKEPKTEKPFTMPDTWNVKFGKKKK